MDEVVNQGVGLGCEVVKCLGIKGMEVMVA